MNARRSLYKKDTGSFQSFLSGRENTKKIAVLLITATAKARSMSGLSIPRSFWIEGRYVEAALDWSRVSVSFWRLRTDGSCRSNPAPVRR